MRARSLIWNNFNIVGANRAMCKHCSVQISYNGGSMGNLSRHMKLKHPFIQWHNLIPTDDPDENDKESRPEKQSELTLESELKSRVQKPIGAKRSFIWNHFANYSENRAMCNHCSAKISYSGGSMGNLNRHIKLRHPFIRFHSLILDDQEEEGSKSEEQPDKPEQLDHSLNSEQQSHDEQPKSPKVPPLKPKYEIIDGKIAPSSPIRSNNSSPAFDGNVGNLYEKQIEFVDGYLGQTPFVCVETEQSFAPPPSKIAKRENAYQRSPNLDDLRTRAEIQLMRAKTSYLTKQMENLDVERSVMLLKAKKLELEVEKLRNEARGNTWPTEPQ